RLACWFQKPPFAAPEGWSAALAEFQRRSAFKISIEDRPLGVSNCAESGISYLQFVAGFVSSAGSKFLFLQYISIPSIATTRSKSAHPGLCLLYAYCYYRLT